METFYTHVGAQYTCIEMKKAIVVGNKAPDAVLRDVAGAPVRFSDAWREAPIVLFFYPGDKTPACTIQLCAVRDDLASFEKLGIRVFGINGANAESHRAFAEAHRLSFPLLTDEKHTASRAFGAVYAFGKLALIRRTVVGISSDGILRFVRRGFPKHAEIFKAMKPFAKIERVP